MDLHWRTNLITFLIFVAPLAAIGLLAEDMANALDCCVVGNISANTWQLHAPTQLLLVLPQESNMLPDWSASDNQNEPKVTKVNQNETILIQENQREPK